MEKSWSRKRIDVNVERVKSLIMTGCSRPQICNAMDLDIGVLTRVLHENNLQTKGQKGKQPFVDYEVIRRLREEGHSTNSIGKSQKIGAARVKTILESMGFERLPRSGGRPRTKVDLVVLRDLCSQGLPVREIASQLKICNATYYNLCKRYGIPRSEIPPMPRRLKSTLDVKYVTSLVALNLTQKEIGKIVGIPRNRIGRMMMVAGIRPSWAKGRRRALD